MGAFCALAVITKFTAVLLFPTLFALLVLTVYPLRRLSGTTAGGLAGLVVSITRAPIWAVYGFCYAPGPHPHLLYHFQGNPYVVYRVPALSEPVGLVARPP